MSQNMKIPVVINGIYALEVSGKINRINARFIIDTGLSAPLALDMKGIEKFQVTKEDGQSTKCFMFNDSTELAVGIIKELSVGSFLIQNVPTAILDATHFNAGLIEAGLQPVDGLIGGAFLKEYRAVINYERGTLNLFEGAV